uniref:Protein Shroom3 n=1 Tax=Gongylonema pulchrum TaxID=637853 RepID=A0A183EY06_9BILA
LDDLADAAAAAAAAAAATTAVSQGSRSVESRTRLLYHRQSEQSLQRIVKERSDLFSGKQSGDGSSRSQSIFDFSSGGHQKSKIPTGKDLKYL